ncbi:UNVERIFIED_CONTAM: hypothetical protein K2H54_051436 [Gekko kuhli]
MFTVITPAYRQTLFNMSAAAVALLVRCALLGLLGGAWGVSSAPEEGEKKAAAGAGRAELPTVVLAILARNAQHSLPYHLGALERLDYPKERISLW